MRILVTGATGYVGNAVLGALLRAGHDVTAVVRSLDKASLVFERLRARAVEGDIARPITLTRALEQADVIVHAAVDGSANAGEIDRRFVEYLLEVLPTTSRRRRLVYTSGLWVLGDTGGQLAGETAPTTHPAELVAWRPAVERLVASAPARGIDAWTIRPGIVYGGSGGITSMLFASAEIEGAVRIVGDGDNHWPLVHRDDLADLYMRVVERAPGQRLLHATDGSRFTLRRIAEALSHAAGAGGRVISTSPSEARKSMGAFADALALDQQVSSELSASVVGWTAKHPSIIDEAPVLWRTYRTVRAA